MENSKRSFWSTVTRGIAYFCLFLIVAYVLSIGPVVGSLQTPQGLPLVYVGPLTTFYAPLTWVADHNRFLGEMLVKYIKFFTPDFDDP
jgi:hypothetical protein